MSALVRLLYPSPPASRSAPRIIGWWERRRLQFNLVVGATGIVSLLAINIISLLPPDIGPARIPPGAIVVYAVLANMFYTAGWGFELAFNAWWGDDPPAIGPILFRQGLIFSVGLTLLPVGLAGLVWMMQLFRWLT